MPMPEPMMDENHDDWMQRCMGDGTMMDEYDDAEQRQAVCELQWRKMENKDTGALSYSHIVSAVASTPWAILPSMLATIMDLVSFRSAGGRLTAEEIQSRIGAVARPQPRQAGEIAILPLFGTIFPRANMMTEMSGGTTVERFTRDLRALLADPAISAIVIDIDSPGGAVTGVDELSAEIYEARQRKPIVAIANNMAASAAYWIGTAAESLSVTPTGDVGSIGVLAAHEDVSKAQETAGIKTTLISAGRYKTEGNPFAALDDEARGAIQERVDDYYDMFVRAVARNRAVSLKAVKEGFGEGRMVGAKRAVEMGMADYAETMDQMIERLMKRQNRRQGARAEGESITIELAAEAFDVPVAVVEDARRRRLRLAGRR